MKNALLALIAVFVAIVLSLAIVSLVGENPINVLGVLLNGSFGSSTSIGYSLFYMTPLLFTGLSVAWAMRVGLFNVGSEGQMAMGGIAMAAVGIFFPGLPVWLSLVTSILAGFVVGGAWAWLAAWLKVKRGCHEVLATILLNFIAYGIVGYLVVGPLKNEFSQSPETREVAEAFRLQSVSWLGGSSPVNTSLYFGLFCAIVYLVVFNKTVFGFRSRWVGESSVSAEFCGVSVSKHIFMNMFISGGIAGLAGMSQILGYFFKAREGFTSGYGFLGIAVALVGMLNGWGIIASALLFGALLKGSLDLEMDTDKISRDLAMVIQALVILLVVTREWWQGLFRRRRES